MSILILQVGRKNPILRKKTEKVREITPKIRGLISDMIETCESNEGVGLAANQVGKSLRLFIVRVPISDREYFVKEFINPKIVRISREKVIMEEGCLSLPNFLTAVKRAESLTMEYQNKRGQAQTIKASNLLARIIQHEIDHLNGILICDKK